ncbi:hypothetical protein BJ546DRAFT_951858 [Cryomyces antarcticus]
MASILRHIVAGPRVRHAEAGLDLCYVTDNIIATSGPSGTYPQRAYRNPLDALVKFLDYKHGADWAIWEFRAEGTGYPDSEVHNRVWHYPFPDHHPPPFALIPNVMASMRNWLKGKDTQGKNRVVVVHCKAGKGRSGTASCSYLISEEGWTMEDALKRFTERRMRPGFGAGVSIPSQLRWVGYVDRWAKHGKIYVERQVEVLEVHVWGLRDGVKIAAEGFVDEGRTIKTFHVFSREERETVRGDIKNTSGFADAMAQVMGTNSGNKAPKSSTTLERSPNEKAMDETKRPETETSQPGNPTINSSAGADVLFRPSTRVVLPTNDINIDFERRNKATYGWTMVTSVAHVWFNAFFEGHGAENNGNADDSGVFEIEWDAMDGIKGSTRKGIRAFDRLAVVWRAIDGDDRQSKVVISEPAEGEPDLGLRADMPTSASISRASSVRSHHKPDHVAQQQQPDNSQDDDDDHNHLTGIRSHGPEGEELVHPPQGPLPLSSDLPGPTHTLASPEMARSQAPQQRPVSGVVSGTQHVGTADLPGGVPEEEMQGPSGHAMGHVGRESGRR